MPLAAEGIEDGEGEGEGREVGVGGGIGVRTMLGPKNWTTS